MKNRDIHILIVNGGSRNGMAILRSLGPKQYVCDITAQVTDSISLKLSSAFRSKYARKVHSLPVSDMEEVYLHALIALLKKEDYMYLLAAGTRYTNFISKYKDRLSNYVTPLVEDFSKLWLVHNKVECMKWGESIGIPVPTTYEIKNLQDLQYAAAEIDYPVVVKYPDSAGSSGLWTFPCGGTELVQEYMKRVPNINGDRECCEDCPIIQEWISGSLMDTTAFAVDGEPYAILSQERLLTGWLDGGGGIVNITNDVPEIKQYAKTIIETLKWTGPIEMDWIKDSQTGEFKLLEINPKFWGTTQLTVSAGLDYPAWLLDNAEGREILPINDYQIGLMYRWIISEISAILTVPSDRRRLFYELKNFVQRFSYSPCQTDIWFSDIKPSLIKGIHFFYSYLFKGGLFHTFRALSRKNRADLFNKVGSTK